MGNWDDSPDGLPRGSLKKSDSDNFPAGKTNSELLELIRKAKETVDRMTPEELREMIRAQGEAWAKSETQWAKDLQDGKCKRD